jgi:hypothetical protein
MIITGSAAGVPEPVGADGGPLGEDGLGLTSGPWLIGVARLTGWARSTAQPATSRPITPTTAITARCAEPNRPNRPPAGGSRSLGGSRRVDGSRSAASNRSSESTTSVSNSSPRSSASSASARAARVPGRGA